MKIKGILESAMKHPAWGEGYDAFYGGKKSEHCPYEEEAEERKHWMSGWQYASQEG